MRGATPDGIHRVPLPVAVCAVAAGYYHSLAQSSDGRLFAFGDASHGQRGDARHNDDEPGELALPTPIERVVCGAFHSLAAGRQHQLLAWGSGNDGQCGETRGVYERPHALAVPWGDGAQVVALAAGYAHSAAVVAHDDDAA